MNGRNQRVYINKFLSNIPSFYMKAWLEGSVADVSSAQTCEQMCLQKQHLFLENIFPETVQMVKMYTF